MKVSERRMELVEEPTTIEAKIKQISSVKEMPNESDSISDASFSSDSDTVPYHNRIKASDTSTARMKKGS
jgi:hypothetical protein